MANVDIASRPFNPDIANAFFRAGEIEVWGRGIERIFITCREAGTPVPHLRFDSNGLRTEFAFAAEYLHSIQAKTPIGTLPETPLKTPDSIVRLLREQPTLTATAAAETLGRSHSAILRAIRKLREEGRLRHVGPRKGGYWKIME